MTIRQTSDTSAQSLGAISGLQRKSVADLIESVITQAVRSGSADVSMREVQQALVSKYDRSVDMSTISARVNELVAAKRLVRDKTISRVCSVTGQTVHPLTVVAVQERMFY